MTFPTDGGEEVRTLTELVTPEAKHVLDWFHITMRLTVLSQYASGIVHHDKAEGARLLSSLDSIKWLLWHGNQHRAGEEIAFFEGEVDGLEVGYPNLGKFKRAAHEFAVYIASNASSLINYGKRYRSGERISSCLAESMVNAVIRKCFAKRQQMQWTKRGTPAAADPNANPRRHASAAVQALVSGAGQRQWKPSGSGRCGVNPPQILMPSNGQTEGQISRLKTLKRAMYGRVGVSLLRTRMLPLEPVNLQTMLGRTSRSHAAHRGAGDAALIPVERSRFNCSAA